VNYFVKEFFWKIKMFPLPLEIALRSDIIVEQRRRQAAPVDVDNL